MRLPKATMRKNGHPMLTAKVDIHIGLWDIENAIANKADYDEEKLDDFLANLTKSKVYKMTIDTLLERGIFWMSDSNLDADKIHDKAVELFPELAEKKESS